MTNCHRETATDRQSQADWHRGRDGTFGLNKSDQFIKMNAGGISKQDGQESGKLDDTSIGT